ncbi:MAG TPA: preprotein translocase subunit SecG [Burkholderiaceae bacterium]|nr:preprotein translocase subunit SecG [Burkholderiaceae bacterium]
MNTLHTIIIVIQVLSALAIIGLVLVQHGKGADMGAAFGSGASGSLFGATGSSNFLSKSTALAAAVFFVATLVLALLGGRQSPATGGVMDNLPIAPATSSTAAPAVPAAPAASNAPAPAPAVNTEGHPAPAAPAKPADQSSQIPK